MTNYLIEFRFQGTARGEIKRLIYEVNKKFRTYSKNHQIPYITILAPFSTNNQKQLILDFKKTCENNNIIKFDISSYGCFSKSKVVYVNINPSKEMLKFRKDLIKKLKSYCSLNSTYFLSFLGIGIQKKYSPHTTIAKNLSQEKFTSIRDFFYRKKEPQRRYIFIRATLMKNNKILYGYNFILKRLLNRFQAKNKGIYLQTIQNLRRIK